MTVIEFLGAAGLGSLVGAILMHRMIGRRLNSPAFIHHIEEQLHIAFQAGFMTAADIVTMSGEEELAGKLRRTAASVRASNDNH